MAISLSLGLPRTAGQRPLVGAHLVDSLGTGLVLSFVVIYFARTTSLGIATIGAALTTARLLALPTAIVTGRLIDRFGARATAAAGNALSALAYAGFLTVHQVWQIVLVGWLAQVGAVAYWTSSTGLVVLAAPGGERTRWFALVQTLRNAGLAVGAALGSVLVGAGELRAVVALNAVSYLVAAALLVLWRPAGPAPRQQTTAPSPGSYRDVLRDGRYLLLVGINLCNVFGSLVTSLLIAVYLVQSLHQPAWLAGSLLMMNGLQVVLTQGPVARRLEHLRPTRVVAAAGAVNALAFALFALLAAAPGWAVVAGLYAAMFLYNLAETMATPFAEELSVGLARPDLRGRYLGVYQLSWNTGQALAPGLLTLLLSHGAVWPWVFLAVTAVAGVPALLLLERLVTGTGTSTPTAG
ncbi:MFS transporter [Kitasatospora azatica]|uniref:MFS transporter n=1 Tax=Kitasatospora azatica TaxID=58347 RepID=UPI000689247E|nr:MFS transporter [Kitasatospora azatica]